MERATFLQARKKLGKTQSEIAKLLGVSIKAVHSYEQGWRSIPPHAGRQIYFLLSRWRDLHEKPSQPCWIVKKLPTLPQRKVSGLGIPGRPDYVGLSTAPSVNAKCGKTGRKRWKFADSVQYCQH